MTGSGTDFSSPTRAPTHSFSVTDTEVNENKAVRLASVVTAVEEAQAAMFEELGFAPNDLEKLGVQFATVTCNVSVYSDALLPRDNKLEVRVRLQKLGEKTLSLDHHIHAPDGRLCYEAETLSCCISSESQYRKLIPLVLREALNRL